MKAGKHTSENSGNNVEKDDSSYKKAYAKWSREVLKPALEKYPERRDEFVTTSSQKVERLYTSLDTSDIDFATTSALLPISKTCTSSLICDAAEITFNVNGLSSLLLCSATNSTDIKLPLLHF